MKRDGVATVLTLGVLGLGGLWVYQVWKKNGGSLGTLGGVGGVLNSVVSQTANPYAGSLAAANEGVAAAMKNGDATLNRIMADILGSPVSEPRAGFENFGPVISIPPTMLGPVIPGFGG